MLLRNLCLPMIMRPATATPRIKIRRSIFSLGGVRGVDTYSKDKVAAPSPPRTEGKGVGKVEG